MPSSSQNNITPIVTEMLKIQPKTILDIGVGTGKWGFLAREYLEVWNNRVFPNQWIVKIDGIEIFKKYIDEFFWLNGIYNKIYLGDACELIYKVQGYDLILAGDVIEHLIKERGIELIKKSLRKSKYLITSIPIGKNWLDNVIVADNQYEKHQAVWEVKDLEKISQETNVKIKHIIWEGVRGDGYITIWGGGL